MMFDAKRWSVTYRSAGQFRVGACLQGPWQRRWRAVASQEVRCLRRALLAAVVAACIGPLVASCGAPTPSDSRILAEAVIGPEGGELRAAALRVTFPAGAVDRPIRVTASRAAGYPRGSPGPVFDLGPSGLAFRNKPTLTIDLPGILCRGSRGYQLGTVVAGRWRSITGSRLERDPCRVVGEPEHFSPFGPLPAGDPPSQAAQNYLIEGVLNGVYHHRAHGQYREFRSDGLQTKGTTRFVRDPLFCIVGLDDRADVRTAVEAVLRDAVSVLTDGRLTAMFLPVPCVGRLEPPCPREAEPTAVLPAGRVYFLEGCGAQGIPWFAEGRIGEVWGSEITGGILIAPALPAAELSPTTVATIRHELGHVFGLDHTWGDPDIMSYRERTPDFASHEREAFAVLYQLDPGLGLRDLVALGLLEDRPDIMDEVPSIVHAELAADGARSYRPDNRAAVGDEVFIVGQRLTVAFMNDLMMSSRGFAYAPPIVQFGAVQIVPDLRGTYQLNIMTQPAGVLRVPVPQGAMAPLALATRGYVATFPTFTIDGDPVPRPAETPRPATGLTCGRPPGLAGRNRLAWSLPEMMADGVTRLDPRATTTRLTRNGEIVAEFPATAADFEEAASYPVHERDLYQVFLVDNATGQVGIPSEVCLLEPRMQAAEVTLLVIDRTGSMATPRADGTTRFQGVVGPLAAPQVPRAFAALDEVFGGPAGPRVAIYSFNYTDGIIDEVAALTGATFTSDRTVAEAALLGVRARGPTMRTPLVDTMCVSASFLLAEFRRVGAGAATLRLFTDGEENMSVGVEECPASCVSGIPGGVPWRDRCRPGTCPSRYPSRDPDDCTACQVDLFRQYCAEVVNFFVEYFGPAGPFSPLPPDAGYFLDLAVATDGRFTYNSADGAVVVGLPGDLAPLPLVPDSIEVECAGPRGSRVLLPGSALDELHTEDLDFLWTGPFAEGGGLVHGRTPTVTLPAGAHVVQLLVSDAHQDSLPAFLPVDVLDSTPPDLMVSVWPDELWPPNHEMRTVRATVEASDRCDSDVSVRLVSVVSDEPDDAVGSGDGSTAPDIAGVETGTDDREFELRAERQGAGDGRVYAVTYEATDAAGNRARAEATVSVPHDRSGR